MRIRTIKPEFWTSESVGKLSRDARLLFIGLWSLADDSGRTRGAIHYIRGQLLAYDSDITPADVGRWLEELIAGGMVRRYEVDGNTYLDIPKWLNHQKIEKPSASKIPPFPKSSPNPPRDVCEDSPSGPRTKDLGSRTLDLGSSSSLRSEEIPTSPSSEGDDGEQKPKRKRTAKPERSERPTLDEWVAHCTGELAWHDRIEIEKAWAYYEGIGWIVGKGKGKPVQDWHAVARGWKARAAGYAEERKQERQNKRKQERGDEPPPLPMAPDPDTPWTPTPVIHHPVKPKVALPWPDEEIPGA